MKQHEYSIAEARDRLAKLVREAERGQPIRITRRGKPAAVLISDAEFQQSQKRPTRGPGDAILEWRTAHRGVAITDTEIDGWRDRSSGRVPRFAGED